VTSRPRSRVSRPSPAAERMRRYRANLRRGVAFVPVPGAIVDGLARAGLPRDCDAASRAEIGAAIAAAFDPATRAIRLSIGTPRSCPG
jgi:ClpP class serine protease